MTNKLTEETYANLFFNSNAINGEGFVEDKTQGLTEVTDE